MAIDNLSCFCRRRKIYRRKQIRLGSVELYDETYLTQEHLPGCELSEFVANRRRRSLGFRCSGLAGLLNRAVSIAFYMRSGAGGFSFGPDITYYAIVDESVAPAFRLLNASDGYLRFKHQDIDRMHWNILLEMVSKKIQRLFYERKASPTDMNHSNQNLLHMLGQLVCAMISRLHPVQLNLYYIQIADSFSFVAWVSMNFMNLDR